MTPATPQGPQVFDHLDAEREPAWLAQVFVEPDSFAAMAADVSTLIFGPRGSGKTALRFMLAHHARTQRHPPPLVVNWRPSLLPGHIAGSDAALRLFQEASRETALELLKYVACNAPQLANQRAWVQQIIVDFLRHSLGPRLEIELDKLEERWGAESIAALTHVLGDVQLTQPMHELSLGTGVGSDLDTGLDTNLIESLKRLGLGGIWLMVDQLEPWAQADEAALTRSITALFASLAYIDDVAIKIKWFLPSQIQGRLIASQVLSRRRADVFELHWHAAGLQAVVERRLAVALGQPHFQLRDLVEDPTPLIERLRHSGGDLPRGWLEIVQPFAHLYAGRALTSAALAQVKTASPLWMDAAGEVFLGYRRVEGLQVMERRLLHHLIVRYPDACSRTELYYRIYRDLPRELGQEDEGWVEPTAWRGLMDNIIYRIRKTLKHNGAQDDYLVTVHGGFLRLQHLAVR